MITIKDSIRISVTDDEIKSVMEKARTQLFISKRDNLRNRHANIQYDCILRGYIGEFAITKWMNEQGIFFDKTNYKADGENIDIDFLYKEKNIELKTSLIPDADFTIEKAIENRDIKLIKRENEIINLKGDIHLQIFFNQRRLAKDEWLASRIIDIEEAGIDELFDKMLARCYRNTAYFVAWIDKQRLIEKFNNLPESDKTWSFKNSQRQFWNCKVINSKKPIDLPEYLKNIIIP